MFSRHLWPVIAVRTPFCIVFFVLGCLAARVTQMVAWLFLKGAPSYYYAMIGLTKSHFLVLLSFVTLLIYPLALHVSFDPEQMPNLDNFYASDGHLVSILQPNAVWMLNHQIYTDWLYLWFIAYTGRFASAVYIVLKANLAKIPVMGAGMKNFRFLFLLRKWELDKVQLTNQLLEMDADARGRGPAAGVRCVANKSAQMPGLRLWPAGLGSSITPYHLIVFPEGTVKLAHTRKRSDDFCAKLGKKKLEHTLLPRTRGLFLMLRLLRNTVEVVYDVTTGYEGLKPLEYGEDVFTLKAFYLKGYGPPGVHFNIRSFRIDEIPLGDTDEVDVDKIEPAVFAEFEAWLYDVWFVKDALMDRFYKTGSFVAAGDERTRVVTADFKLRTHREALSPFFVLFTIVLFAITALRFVLRLQ